MLKVINCFEHSTVVPQYNRVSVLRDSIKRDDSNIVDIKLQVSYGIIQFNESSYLKNLLIDYTVQNGAYAKDFLPYIDLIGTCVLHQDTDFKSLLRLAGQDHIMRKCQDAIYEENFINPALKWADNEGFTLPLSTLVILDSFVHSGSVPMFIRRRFKEPVPRNGGTEKDWISEYILHRKKWMLSHKNTLLRNCAYRMNCFAALIADDNWMLEKLPIFANGVKIE